MGKTRVFLSVYILGVHATALGGVPVQRFSYALVWPRIGTNYGTKPSCLYIASKKEDAAGMV